MTVLIRTQGLRGRGVAPRAIRARAEAMLRALRLEEAELSILLCDDATIRTLNRAWRGLDRPTDVLAFPLEEPAPVGRRAPGGAPRALGDVVVSVDTARRQAAADDRRIASRVVFLLAHGLLHLMGHDHRDPEETRRMNAMTDVLVSAAGKRRSLGKTPVDNRGPKAGGSRPRGRRRPGLAR